MLSEAITRLPINDWIGILNCWRGISSLSFSTKSLPTLQAFSLLINTSSRTNSFFTISN